MERLVVLCCIKFYLINLDFNVMDHPIMEWLLSEFSSLAKLELLCRFYEVGTWPFCTQNCVFQLILETKDAILEESFKKNEKLVLF